MRISDWSSDVCSSDLKTLKEALDTLKGKPRVKRTMWSRRAQEYEAKINSGDLVSIAEVVRDLFRAEDQPEQSYSERQIFEGATSRLARELAAMEEVDEPTAQEKILDILRKAAAIHTKAKEQEAADACEVCLRNRGRAISEAAPQWAERRILKRAPRHRGACVNDDGAAPAGAALFRLRALSECINLAIHTLRRIPMRLLPLLAMLPLIACSGQSDATDAASTASAGGAPVAAQGSGTSRS